ncbi:hypothetical protein AAVH_22591 [Aphelenchoides avenae]|nr:hypothetical protein AAVH_22591 [Aphelenchus avenae]
MTGYTLSNTKLCYTTIDSQEDYTWTWPGAQGECESNNASLVSVPDLATNFDILQYARDAAIGDIGLIAIGLSYNKTADAWTWSDGSLPTFTNWAAGYPKKEKYVDQDRYYGMSTYGGDASLWRNYPYNMAQPGLICQRPSEK